MRDLQSKIHCEVRGNSCSGSSRSTQGHSIKSPRARAGKIELRETCCFHSAGWITCSNKYVWLGFFHGFRLFAILSLICMNTFVKENCFMQMYSSWRTCDTEKCCWASNALSGAWQKARGAGSLLLQTRHFTAFPDVFGRCRLSLIPYLQNKDQPVKKNWMCVALLKFYILARRNQRLRHGHAGKAGTQQDKCAHD